MQTPTNYVPPEERVDLTMRFHDVHRPHQPPFTNGHLNYLECGGRSIFGSDQCCNLFFNALRLRWKVSGRSLRTMQEHANDLAQFLRLQVDNKFIIAELLTETACNHLFDHERGDALSILAIIVRDIYEKQWNHWTEMNTDGRHKGAYRLVVAHAQATANQLSNNVLAFERAAPELKEWAEETAARHLMSVVTPGHLPTRPRNTKKSTSGQGDRKYKVPYASTTAHPSKRKAPAFSSSHYYNRLSPAVKKPRIKHEGLTDTSTPTKHYDTKHQTINTPTHTQRLKDQMASLDSQIASLSAANNTTNAFWSSPVANVPLSSEHLRAQQSEIGGVVVNDSGRKESKYGSEEGEVSE